MDPLTIALLAGGGLLVYKGFTSGRVNVPPGGSIFDIPLLGGSGGLAPVAGQVPWPPGVGQPGFVTIGGQPAPASYSLGNLQTAIQASGVTTAIAGGTIGIAGALGGTAGAAGAIGTTAATAIPIIGIGVAAAGLVLGIIAKHHADAVAKEASSLNQSVPIIYQRYVLICQAAVRGEITTITQADNLIAQAIDDYYIMVKSTIQGRWTFIPNPDAQNIVPKVGLEEQNPKTKANTRGLPSGITCNGPCAVGHYIEFLGLSQTHNAVVNIRAGKHGTLRLLGQASHAGYAGMPEIDVAY